MIERLGLDDSFGAHGGVESDGLRRSSKALFAHVGNEFPVAFGGRVGPELNRGHEREARHMQWRVCAPPEVQCTNRGRSQSWRCCSLGLRADSGRRYRSEGAG